MNIDGNAIANDIFKDVAERVTQFGRAPVLTILTCTPNFETQKYLELKRRRATGVGIRTNIIELPADVSTDDVEDCIRAAVKNADGLILQLPFPKQVDIARVLGAIPTSLDVDALNPKTTAVLSPVVGACKEILARHSVTVKGKRTAIIGRGRLVGAPAERWFKQQGATVTVTTREEGNIADAIRDADIILCGAGSPGIVRPEMIKKGVVILDAGTSEEGGKLRGDVDPACAEKASLFTPVPGGIGPVTVAVLFRNLLILVRNESK